MLKPKPLPPQAKLLAAFEYAPDTGCLYRKKKNGGRTLVISKCINGYGRTKYKGQPVKVSRVIWVMMTGEDPGAMTVDHVNRVRGDNRWCNLRLADLSLQQRNKGVHRTSTTGLKGAHRTNSGEGKRFSSAIMRDGKTTYLGRFDSAEKAHAAYVAAGGIP